MCEANDFSGFYYHSVHGRVNDFAGFYYHSVHGRVTLLVSDSRGGKVKFIGTK